MAKNTQVLFEENDGWIIGPVEKVRPNVQVTISWNYLTFSPTIFLYLQSKKRKGNLFRMTYCVRVNRLCSTYYVMTVFLRRNKCRKWSVWLAWREAYIMEGSHSQQFAISFKVKGRAISVSRSNLYGFLNVSVQPLF